LILSSSSLLANALARKSSIFCFSSSGFTGHHA
jgi:hypothetical protein